VNQKTNKEKKMASEKISIVVDESHPTSIRLREAIGKMSELGARRADVMKQREAELERLQKIIRGSREEKFGREADMLLENREVADSHPSIRELDHQIEVLDFAIARLQEKINNDLRPKFSAMVCSHPANVASYLAIEKRIASAVNALARANEDEATFLGGLYTAGCSSVSFRPMAVKEIGITSDPNSRATAYKRELQQFVPEAAV
jgi:hypothetical protein